MKRERGIRLFNGWLSITLFALSNEIEGLSVKHSRGQPFNHNIVVTIPFLLFLWVGWGEDQTTPFVMHDKDGNPITE